LSPRQNSNPREFIDKDNSPLSPYKKGMPGQSEPGSANEDSSPRKIEMPPRRNTEEFQIVPQI